VIGASVVGFASTLRVNVYVFVPAIFVIVSFAVMSVRLRTSVTEHAEVVASVTRTVSPRTARPSESVTVAVIVKSSYASAGVRLVLLNVAVTVAAAPETTNVCDVEGSEPSIKALSFVSTHAVYVYVPAVSSFASATRYVAKLPVPPDVAANTVPSVGVVSAERSTRNLIVPETPFVGRHAYITGAPFTAYPAALIEDAIAVDVAGANGARLEWMFNNIAKFGWSWEVLPVEPWHIRYVAGDNIPEAVTLWLQSK
jgi:hypothetical protein